MQDLALYAAVFVASATPVLEVWIAVPAGIAAGLPAIPAALVGIAGNFLTVAAAVLAGDGLRSWWRKRRAARPTDGDSPAPTINPRTERIRERFGLPGLALASPFIIGSHLGALGAVALGSPRAAVLSWFLASLVLQAVVFGGMAALGVEYFQGSNSDADVLSRF